MPEKESAPATPFREEHFVLPPPKSFVPMEPVQPFQPPPADVGSWKRLAQTTPADDTYHVPTKFGMSGMLAITTLMAIIFGLLRNFPGGLNFSLDPSANTHPVAYIFLGVLVLSTCLAQMLFGGVPRAASCAVGAILFPLCILVVAVYNDGLRGFAAFICGIPFLAIAGAGFGYLAGGCTAGCFLLMDKFDRWYMSRVLKHPPTAPQASDEPILAELVESKSDDAKPRDSTNLEDSHDR